MGIVSVSVSVSVCVGPTVTVIVGGIQGGRVGSRGVGMGFSQPGGSPISDTSDDAVTRSAGTTNARLYRKFISNRKKWQLGGKRRLLKCVS